MREETDPSDYSWESFIRTEEEEIGMFSYMSCGGMWTTFYSDSICAIIYSFSIPYFLQIKNVTICSSVSSKNWWHWTV